MAFRFWAYRKWVFPEELTPHPELVAEAVAIAEAEAANNPPAPLPKPTIAAVPSTADVVTGSRNALPRNRRSA
jgi:hypothetical protein